MSRTRRRSTREGGFTLIELLVALMIFALLASAGVILLRGSVDTQQAITENLDALADVQRGMATLDSDLSQATARISRTENGAYAPAFFGRRGQTSEPLFEFVRGGWANPSGQRRPALQRIAYWWREGRLERVANEAVDGGIETTPAMLFDHVTDLAIRYRDIDGSWKDQWEPALPQDMPLAVELVMTREGEAPLTLLFLVGPQPAPDSAETLVDPDV